MGWELENEAAIRRMRAVVVDAYKEGYNRGLEDAAEILVRTCAEQGESIARAIRDAKK